MIRFGRYHLDPVQGLTRGTQEVRLTPRSLAVLRVLAERAGQVVTKDELFGTVWQGTAVSDAALASCIQELRHALQDDVRRPRFIETLHRRGYRFVAETSPAKQDEPLLPCPPPDVTLVGRDDVVAELLRAYEAADSGRRQTCFVIGEAGMGKTSVLHALLESIAARERALVTSGQCVEQYGSAEPFHPLLDALMRLCRQRDGERWVAALERYAPTWLVQLPGLLAPKPLAALQRTSIGTTRSRMLRELTNAIEVIASQHTLVFCIEDLHWSDPSTLDWITAVAQRRERARVLLIATFRPGAAPQPDHSAVAVSDALRGKGLCRELLLTGLDESAVAAYLAARCAGSTGQNERLRLLARRIHQHAAGNPLFMVNLFDQLVERGIIARDGGSWMVTSAADVADLAIPDNIRRTIERLAAQIPPSDRELLDVASVAGVTFSVAAVAAAAGRPPGDVETALGGLVRQRRFVRDAGVAESPDGTISTQMEFVHALYRDVLYANVASGHRVELHRRIAELQERACGDRASEIAAELAMHFERGRDPNRAILYLHHAAKNASSRSAFREARSLYQHALELLETQPREPRRIEQEVRLRIELGAAIMATSGFGAPEVEAAYSRARSLCQEIGDTLGLFPSMWGLWLFYWGRGAVDSARELADELLALTETRQDDSLRLQALHASWATAFSQGNLDRACALGAEGIRLYDADRHADMAATYGSHDAGVCARIFLARALALRGRRDESIRIGDEAIALASRLQHPFTTALSLTFRAAADQSCRDAAGAARYAAEAMAIARKQDFKLMLAWCSVFDGWAAVEQSGSAEGFERIQRGIAEARASGSDQFVPHLLAILADACLKIGRTGEGSKATAEALELARRTGERFIEPELHRLRGELLLAGGGVGQAEAAFLTAMDLARQQHSEMLALRAAVSLAGVWHSQHQRGRARQLILDARAGLPDSASLLDVADAEALLARC
jgi:DNA-binding winged helix-turn-helix (wHTH) protein/predicted ATPase